MDIKYRLTRLRLRAYIASYRLLRAISRGPKRFFYWFLDQYTKFWIKITVYQYNHMVQMRIKWRLGVPIDDPSRYERRNRGHIR